jgi:hypothetical protein
MLHILTHHATLPLCSMTAQHLLQFLARRSSNMSAARLSLQRRPEHVSRCHEGDFEPCLIHSRPDEFPTPTAPHVEQPPATAPATWAAALVSSPTRSANARHDRARQSSTRISNSIPRAASPAIDYRHVPFRPQPPSHRRPHSRGRLVPRQ